MNHLNSILVTAYAKAPQGTSMYESYKHVGIVLEVDQATHKIIETEFTFITNLAQRFFNRLLVGVDLTSPLDPIIEQIQAHYFAPSAGSIAVALRNAQKRYVEKINEH